jgi:hypothetical protein
VKGNEYGPILLKEQRHFRISRLVSRIAPDRHVVDEEDAAPADA